MRKSLLADYFQLGAPVFCATGFGGIIGHWFIGTIPFVRKPCTIDAFFDQVLHHCLCPHIRKRHIIIDLTNIIGMTIDLDLQRGIITQQQVYIVQLGSAFLFEIVFIHIKKDVFQNNRSIGFDGLKRDIDIIS